MSTESFVDVLIIGAGPAGVMCATALASAGVKVRVIDKRDTRLGTGQADCTEPRTTEVLHSYGLSDRLLRESVQLHMAAFYSPGEQGGIKCTDRKPDMAPTARFPFKLALNQAAVEAIFLDSMKANGLEVDLSIAPTSITFDEAKLSDPTAHAVKVTLQHLETSPTPGRKETVNAKFVLGADGAHSWVRKALGITMDGDQTEHIWGAVDLVPDTDFPDIRNRSTIHSVNGSIMIIPRENNMVRLYVQLSNQDVVDPSTGRVDKNRMTPDKLMAVAQQSFLPYVLKDAKDINWWTVYIIGQRVASKFSAHERVFIAGDACHTHSPKAGQGMNASINDSHNLAWKLVHVIRGWADLSLLKSYEFERQKYAQDLINFDKTHSELFSAKPKTKSFEDGVSHEDIVKAFKTFQGFASGVGIQYSESAWIDAKHQSCAPNLIIGQRMLPQVFIRASDFCPYDIQDYLLSDARFKVLVFAGNINDKAQLAKVHKLAEELEKPTSFLRKYLKDGQNVESKFGVVTITAKTEGLVNSLGLPALFRPHWTKVLTDDKDVAQATGGGAYDRFGIAQDKATLVIVRPDGFVGTIAPASRFEDVNKYFAGFMRA
ncbi:hypothetical protein CONPUDRAFT_164380 [Coniophora puteana RWD-64-598 SS2]|uniref:FAD binding domain-containing protein n=1 Tax=Coniophora puteana (strain RWD-64-598) TaxID=741705 RepID=A0A5M3MWA5_CONPW|nr:uncharacterized protein CONPUDRAFT_164380 [Coniophora puteana RWD-64-598 SS2]EIW83429.1 hypothetical protein CONPUDRAFT_164380 [Coniophora puteana RWD-64-598 SS2]